MGWVIILVIALLVLAALILLGRLPRRSWELAAAALLIGVAGYAWQGSPDQDGAPRTPDQDLEGDGDGESMADQDQMRERFNEAGAYITLADSQTRRGNFMRAANILRSAASAYPDNADVWVGLGNALIGHSGGEITPAAQYSYQRAADADPDHPAPPFFFGLALAQSGRFMEARSVWTALQQRSPEGAPWLPNLEMQLAQLDQLIASQPGPPVAPTAPNAAGDAELNGPAPAPGAAEPAPEQPASGG